MKLIRLLMSALFIASLPSCALFAGQLDTLSAFNSKSVYRSYQIPSVTIQAARFEPVVSGSIESISVMLSGDSSSGSARIRLFGYEGGGSAPFLEYDLMEPITVHKTRPGLERIRVDLPTPISINFRQFFVAIDQLSPDVVLITDSEEKPVCCENRSELFRYQCLKTDNGRWWTGKYGYGIDVVMSYENDPERRWLKNVTVEAGFTGVSSEAGSLAWGDYNKDSWLDVLVNGQLYQNNAGMFWNISEETGVTGNYAASAFIDANNDGYLDILLLGNRDTNALGSSSLLLSRKGEAFQEYVLGIEPLDNITSFSVADADLDGYLDVFVGQGIDANGEPLPNYLLRNNHQLGFTNNTEAMFGPELHTLPSQGSQWVDLNDDGYLDLYVVKQGENRSQLWLSDTRGSYTLAVGKGGALEQFQSRNTLGGYWQDINGDRLPDLVSPQHIRVRDVGPGERSITTISVSAGAMAGTGAGSDDHEYGIGFMEERGGGVFVDVNNDGVRDLYLASGNPCRNADLFEGNIGERFVNKTSDYGILHVAAGPDAVWVDFNNDGKLDLATYVHGQFTLYQNILENAGNYAAIEFVESDITGTKVDVFAGNQRITHNVASGRGLLMQDPLRLHFGLGDATQVDSVLIQRPGGDEVMLHNIGVNTINRIATTTNGASTTHRILSEVSAFPNPFSENVTIFFTLKTKERVVVRIYSASGDLAYQADMNELEPGNNSITWDAVDEQGKPLSQGMYLYQVIAGSDSFTDHIILSK